MNSVKTNSVLEFRAWKRSAVLLSILVLGSIITSCGGQVNQVAQAVIGTTGQAAGLDRSGSLIDTDRDGIADSIEQQIGTDPLSIDSDHDGLSDHYELWGINGLPLGSIDMSIALTDADGDGVNAALDPDDMAGEVLKSASAVLGETRIPVTTADDLVFLPNDVDGDGIPNHFELNGYFFVLDPDGTAYLEAWDGIDFSKPYVKTDPTQWSSDGDPFSDWEEVTKINMDQRVKSPGDHPCIPAYPKIEAILTSYTVDLIENTTVSSSNGRTAENSWTNSVENVVDGQIDHTFDGQEREGSLGVAFRINDDGSTPAFFIDASLSIYKISGGGTTTISGSVTANDKSGLTATEWSSAQTTSTNTAEAAKLTMNLNVVNSGTLPVSNAKALFNLRLGSIIINSFVLNLSEFGQIDAVGQEAIPIKVTHDGRPSEFLPEGSPLVLSLYQLRTLQAGAPLVIEPVGFTAQTLVWEVDPDTGRRVYLKMGEWDPYQSSIQNSSAKLMLDFRRSPGFVPGTVNGMPTRSTMETRVFCYRPDMGYFGSPPAVYLQDAFKWAFGLESTENGPVVTIRDPITRQAMSSPLANWEFSFDALTLDKILSDPQSFGNLFDLPLEPGNPGERVYTCSAPPEDAEPRIYWASLDPSTRIVRAFSYDVQGLKEMRFKPDTDPDADYDGERMELGYSVNDYHQEFFYSYQLPEGYFWTGREQVIAINRIGKKSVLPITLESNQLGRLVDAGQSTVGFDSPQEYNIDRSYEEYKFTNDIWVLQQPDESGSYTLFTILPMPLAPEENEFRTGLHDAMIINDPLDIHDWVESGTEEEQLAELQEKEFKIDYNYVRKADYGNDNFTFGIATSESEAPIVNTLVLKLEDGSYYVITPLVNEEKNSLGYWHIDKFNWRRYEGI